MKSKDVEKLLRKNGWVLIPGRGKGSHRFYEKEGVIGFIIVPDSGQSDLPPGTLNSILKKAGLK